MLKSNLLFSVFLIICLSSKLGGQSDGSYRFCIEQILTSKKVCLTSGSDIEYKPENNRDDQVWITNNYGYLVSKHDGKGIDLASEFSCYNVLHTHHLENPIKWALYQARPAVSLQSATFDPAKKSMKWKSVQTGNKVVNNDLNLTIAQGLHMLVSEDEVTTYFLTRAVLINLEGGHTIYRGRHLNNTHCKSNIDLLENTLGM